MTNEQSIGNEGANICQPGVGPDFQFLVKVRLLELGHTQKWLAGEVGIDPSSLSRALKRRSRRSNMLVQAISSVLNVSEEQRQKLLDSTSHRDILNTSIQEQNESLELQLLNRVTNLESQVQRLTRIIEFHFNLPSDLSES